MAESDAEGPARFRKFIDRLSELGWIDGRNIQIVARWAAGDMEGDSRYASELTTLAPDLIVAHTSTSVAALQEVGRAVPMVFVSVIDPVGAGIVESLSHPGGNATGFTVFEYAIGAKWLKLLKVRDWHCVTSNAGPRANTLPSIAT